MSKCPGGALKKNMGGRERRRCKWCWWSRQPWLLPRLCPLTLPPFSRDRLCSNPWVPCFHLSSNCEYQHINASNTPYTDLQHDNLLQTRLNSGQRSTFDRLYLQRLLKSDMNARRWSAVGTARRGGNCPLADAASFNSLALSLLHSFTPSFTSQ